MSLVLFREVENKVKHRQFRPAREGHPAISQLLVKTVEKVEQSGIPFSQSLTPEVKERQGDRLYPPRYLGVVHSAVYTPLSPL